MKTSRAPVHRISFKPIRFRKTDSHWVTATLCICLVAVTWAVFGQTIRHDFINYDDPRYVYENTTITRGLNLAGVWWAFTHIHAMNWHPLTTVSHMLDCQLYGLKAGWHHLTNVLLHSFATVLLFIALLRMIRALWRSAWGLSRPNHGGCSPPMAGV